MNAKKLLLIIILQFVFIGVKSQTKKAVIVSFYVDKDVNFGGLNSMNESLKSRLESFVKSPRFDVRKSVQNVHSYISQEYLSSLNFIEIERSALNSSASYESIPFPIVKDKNTGHLKTNYYSADSLKIIPPKQLLDSSFIGISKALKTEYIIAAKITLGFKTIKVGKIGTLGTTAILKLHIVNTNNFKVFTNKETASTKQKAAVLGDGALLNEKKLGSMFNESILELKKGLSRKVKRIAKKVRKKLQ